MSVEIVITKESKITVINHYNFYYLFIFFINSSSEDDPVVNNKLIKKEKKFFIMISIGLQIIYIFLNAIWCTSIAISLVTEIIRVFSNGTDH